MEYHRSRRDSAGKHELRARKEVASAVKHATETGLVSRVREMTTKQTTTWMITTGNKDCFHSFFSFSPLLLHPSAHLPPLSSSLVRSSPPPLSSSLVRSSPPPPPQSLSYSTPTPFFFFSLHTVLNNQAQLSGGQRAAAEVITLSGLPAVFSITVISRRKRRSGQRRGRGGGQR